ncbi:MAG: hypothetical protein OXH59_03075 [Rhodospirillaceae bacterium]|nr:hypothetical protein [Rhodospirillaceae bacterium]
MNKLSTKKRAKILGILVEGISMRAIARLEEVSINTDTKLTIDARAPKRNRPKVFQPRQTSN